MKLDVVTQWWLYCCTQRCRFSGLCTFSLYQLQGHISFHIHSSPVPWLLWLSEAEFPTIPFKYSFLQLSRPALESWMHEICVRYKPDCPTTQVQFVLQSHCYLTFSVGIWHRHLPRFVAMILWKNIKSPRSWRMVILASSEVQTIY